MVAGNMLRQGSETGEQNTPVETRSDVECALLEIGAFIETDAFQGLLAEMRSVPSSQRKKWVQDVALKPEELARRGVVVPDDFIVQRSTFGDNRPTLFCVSKRLPSGNEKVTFTFDNDAS